MVIRIFTTNHPLPCTFQAHLRISKVSFLLCCLRLWFSLVEIEIFPTKAEVSNRKQFPKSFENLKSNFDYIYTPPNGPIIVRFSGGGARSSWPKLHINHSPGYGSNWNINSPTSYLNLTPTHIKNPYMNRNRIHIWILQVLYINTSDPTINWPPPKKHRKPSWPWLPWALARFSPSAPAPRLRAPRGVSTDPVGSVDAAWAGRNRLGETWSEPPKQKTPLRFLANCSYEIHAFLGGHGMLF